MPNADATTETQSGPHPERQFAEACRAAGLAFLEGTRAGWGKRELVAWLVGPYRELSAQVGTESMPPPSMQSAQNAIREETLDELEEGFAGIPGTALYDGGAGGRGTAVPE